MEHQLQRCFQVEVHSGMNLAIYPGEIAISVNSERGVEFRINSSSFWDPFNRINLFVFFVSPREGDFVNACTLHLLLVNILLRVSVNNYLVTHILASNFLVD